MKNGMHRFLGALLGILGFSGCFVTACKKEYGCPNADFKLVGNVKDSEGKGIEGIRVVFRAIPEDQGIRNDTVYSDARGHFEKERLTHNWPDGARTATVKFEDVDGGANGSYKTRILSHDELNVEQTRKGDRNWYSGEFTIHADAVLEEDR